VVLSVGRRRDQPTRSPLTEDCSNQRGSAALLQQKVSDSLKAAGFHCQLVKQGGRQKEVVIPRRDFSSK